MDAGRLFVVATPIGNLEDITLRALRVLRECDAILAEDTRHTRRLTVHHGIATPLRSFHAHSGDEKVTALVAELTAGKTFCLVTDAGTPLVSDPGARLVTAASSAGVRVEPIPGPSAPLAALSVCGLRVDDFRFVGFLPRSGGRRTEALLAIASADAATVLFEAANRLPETLADLARTAGESRRAAVCRELTKAHEEIARGTLAELGERFAEAPRGECTVVVEGRTEPVAGPTDETFELRARELLDSGMRKKDVSRLLSAELGITTRDAYQRLLGLP